MGNVSNLNFRFLNAIILLNGIFLIGHGKTLLHPNYEMGNISLAVDKIELTDSAAIFDLSFYGLPGQDMRLLSDTRLLGTATKKEYRILDCKDLELDKWIKFPDEGFISSKIYFEPINENEKSIHFIEPKGWFIKGISLDESENNKIKTNISGSVEIPSTSWLLIEETGGDFRVNKSYTVPVRDGKFSYDIFTDYPRLFTIARGIEVLEGAWRHTNFWSDGENVEIKITRDDSGNTKFNVSGSDQTNRTLDYIDRYQNKIDSFLNCSPYVRDFNRMKADGSLYTEEAKMLIKQKSETKDPKDKEEVNNKIRALYEEDKMYTPEGKITMEKYYNFMDTSVLSLQNEELLFINQEIKKPSLTGLGEIYRNLKYNSPLTDRLLVIFEDNYSDFMPEHPYSILISQIANELSPVAGNKFIDVKAPDLNGNIVAISDVIKDKIAVIDLWASWCGPCRVRSKALIPVYEKYKDKGFEIIGIAREDGNTEAMEKAIEKDGYLWLNLVDLNDKLGVWSKYRAGLSGGKQILVDENGIIVSIDPTAEEVEAYLESRLK